MNFLIIRIVKFKKFHYLSVLTILLFLNLYFDKEKKIKIQEIVNEPFLPLDTKEYIVKNYSRSKFNLDHPRYHFQEEYNTRKLFKINYSHYPYIKIKNNLSYAENAIFIYNSTGMLNITKLDNYYFKSEKKINILELNHIHISMALDKNYSDLSLITIASVLNTSSFDTYIHFHILGLNLGYEEIKKIIDLSKINKKVEFIFYNAKQIEYDFKGSLKDIYRGFGNIARLLCPQIINNTNKILILDSGDILCQKDLSEIYFYDIEDNYFGWILEDCAGNYLKFVDKFMQNNFHPNGGVFLVNIPLFRKDDLYKKAVFVGKSYSYIECPVQSILITIANYKFKYIPLNYNLNLFYETKEELIKKKTKSIEKWMITQRLSPYKYTIDEIIDAISDPVIQHFYHGKLENTNCHKFNIQWLKYAKLVGKYDILKLKYPKHFLCEKFLQ